MLRVINPVLNKIKGKQYFSLKRYHIVLTLPSNKKKQIKRNIDRFPIFFRHHLTKNIHLSSIQFENIEVKVPPFPESVQEGDLRWEKKKGDRVETDEIVCEIETDKTSVPVHAPTAGVILEVFVESGATVKSGQKLFTLQTGAGAPEKSKTAAPSKPVPKPADVPSKPAPKPAEAPKPAPKVKETPKPQAPPPVRPSAAPPKSPGVIPPPLPGPAPPDPTKMLTGTRTEFKVKMNRMRQRIAQRLKDAQNTTAMLTTFNEIDMTSIMDFRNAHQAAFTKKYGVKLGFMSAFIKSSANALKEQPIVNAVINESEIIYRDYVDISIAVATPKGLVVPVLRNVGGMDYGEIEIAMNELGEKARMGKLAVEDMDGGTFTISNGGVFGSLMGTPIINPPQSAILGMHGTFPRPVALKGQVVIRPMMYIALTYDHRLIDGREAVLFLKKIKSGVEDPRIILAGIYMVWRETISSTATLGFRIEGIKKSDGKSSKDFKTTRTQSQIKEAFRDFCDGFPFAIPKYIQRLKAIKATLEVSSFFQTHEMIGSSLLFVHDQKNANVWLIDFAKTLELPKKMVIDHNSSWVVGNHEDGYLIGIHNLIIIFSEMAGEQLTTTTLVVTAPTDPEPQTNDPDDVT